MKKLDSDELVQLIENACRNFRGQSDTLMGAIGLIFVARMYGWRVARIVVSQATYRKYEKVLRVRYQDLADDRGELSDRSTGLKIADKLEDFWGVVQGRTRSDERPSRFDKKAISD